MSITSLFSLRGMSDNAPKARQRTYTTVGTLYPVRRDANGRQTAPTGQPESNETASPVNGNGNVSRSHQRSFVLHPEPRPTGVNAKTCACADDYLRKQFCLLSTPAGAAVSTGPNGGRLVNECIVPPPQLHFHERFFSCSVCAARPAQKLCCKTWKPFCDKHATEHFKARPSHHVFVNYEIWQYEECFWCMKCNGFVLCDAFDAVLEPLFVSKGSFVSLPMNSAHPNKNGDGEPVTDKHSDLIQTNVSITVANPAVVAGTNLPFSSAREGASPFKYSLSIGTGTMQGWRADNEDAHVVCLGLPSKSLGREGNGYLDLFAVYDGHGGPLVARYAGQKMHELFNTLYLKELAANVPPTSIDIPSMLKKSFLLVDENLTKDTTPDESGSTGCTANVVLVDHLHQKVYCANSGDARSVLCRRIKGKTGQYTFKAIDLSIDHRPSLASERRRIQAAGSRVAFDDEDESCGGRVEGLLAVSRAFGDFDFKQASSLPPQQQAVTCFPDVTVNNLLIKGTGEDGDRDEFVLTACDGIWDCLTSQQACDFVVDQLKRTKRGEEAKVAEALLDKCVAKEIPEDGIGTDNMSVVLTVFC